MDGNAKVRAGHDGRKDDRPEPLAPGWFFTSLATCLWGRLVCTSCFANDYVCCSTHTHTHTLVPQLRTCSMIEAIWNENSSSCVVISLSLSLSPVSR